MDKVLCSKCKNYYLEESYIYHKIDTCIVCLSKEIERLKGGKFTPEELQDLCHNFSQEKDKEKECAFKKGCEDYQVSLFGKGAIEEETERCIKIIENFTPWIGRVNANKLIHSIRMK